MKTTEYDIPAHQLFYNIIKTVKKITKQSQDGGNGAPWPLPLLRCPLPRTQMSERRWKYAGDGAHSGPTLEQIARKQATVATAAVPGAARFSFS